MIFRYRFGHWRLTNALVRVQDTYGLNSQLADGHHIPMWDFDGLTWREAERELRRVQRREKLPSIYIFQSSAPDHWLAFCFCRCSWWRVKHIIAQTMWYDPEWYRGGVTRGYFTIRMGIKNGHVPEVYALMWSGHKPDVKIEELTYWDEYETLAKPRRL